MKPAVTDLPDPDVRDTEELRVDNELPGDDGDPILYRSSLVVFPEWDDEDSPRVQSQKLHKHIWVSGAMRGELAKLRLEAHVRLKTARREWYKLTGYTVPRGATKPQIEEAKRRASPDLWNRMDDARWIVERATEEMERMEAEYASASRSYSIISAA